MPLREYMQELIVEFVIHEYGELKTFSYLYKSKKKQANCQDFYLSRLLLSCSPLTNPK